MNSLLYTQCLAESQAYSVYAITVHWVNYWFSNKKNNMHPSKSNSQFHTYYRVTQTVNIKELEKINMNIYLRVRE